MSSPTKPWERPGVNSMRSSMSTSLLDHMSSQPFSSPRSIPAATAVSRDPPPVPSRNLSAYRSEFNTGYSGFGYGGYGNGYGVGYGTGYSPFGSMYGGMYGGLGMNRFGNDNYSSSGFAQQAELSSRQAFQSIESVVHAVGSVAAMLDSTFQAVYNSFRAVIGVADHMSRLSAHLKRIFSTFALFRIIRWLTSWLLAVVRLQHPSNTDDQMWSRAAEEVLVTGAAKTDILGENRSNWPVMLFFAIVVGGPWLLWKFLSSFDRGTDKKGWASGAEDHYVAVAEYDFSGQSDDELSFKQGATITVAPKEVQPNIRGWLLASLNGQKIGLIPANYVRILGKRRGSHLCHSADTNSKSTESLPVGLSHWDKDFTMQTSSCVSDSLSS